MQKSELILAYAGDEENEERLKSASGGSGV